MALGLLATLPLGAVMGSLAKNPNALFGFVMLPVFVLAAISGIFYPIFALPGWVQGIAQLFPVYWLGLGMRAAFLPDAAAAVEIAGSWRTLETVVVCSARGLPSDLCSHPWSCAAWHAVSRAPPWRSAGRPPCSASDERSASVSETVHNRIAMLRVERSISRRELAEALGVHYQTVGYLERGEYSPSLYLALRIAEYFEVSVEVVFSTTPFQRIGDVKRSA